MQRLTVSLESWPIAGAFTISRGSKTMAEVVVVSLERDGARGWGECVPYRHYGETVAGVAAALEASRAKIESGISREDIPLLLEPKAARNALDCALWNLEAKLAGQPVWQLLNLPEPRPLVTAYTLSLGTVDDMAASAAQAAGRPLLKIKLGGQTDGDRLKAIRRAAPHSRLIVDANEAWRPEELPDLLRICAKLGVELVEQPLPTGKDEALVGVDRGSVLICADESAHDIAGLRALHGKYDAINIKLDKTGGLTPGLALRRAAETLGLRIMVGCMVGTSLSMAPAHLLAQGVEFVDLDGPLLLAADRSPGITYEGSWMHPPPPALWG
jgi:L-alanine-DL-glutamate epimerase-like enolase superfamily enzyme